ncbi:ATP-binding protein [uncultured Desulfobacter sp.]|uniref:sensor histidine kinase n=1 Tax=uncultured Desulfobacter sp. TaxID=240139 RepID=UPI002AAC49F6|nr:ATP-binding protein [uncultured Desulfobacter sp.]
MTVKTRISVLIVGAGVIGSLLFSIALFYELVEQPFELLDNILQEEAYRTVRLVASERFEKGSADDLLLHRELERYWVQIRDMENQRLIFKSELATHMSLPPLEPGHSAIEKAVLPKLNTETDDSREMTLRVRSFTIALNGHTFAAQIARPMEKLEEEIMEMILGFFAGLIFSILGLTAVSRLLAGKILQPVTRMKDLTQMICEENLDQRIPAGDDPDEFNDLARTINKMLDRLQNSFERQREFLFNTSHELKTPLATMRLVVDELIVSDLTGENSSGEEALQSLRIQVLRMDRLVKDLLNLSRLETLSSLDWAIVHVSRLLSSLAEEYRFLAETRGITMSLCFPEDMEIQADSAMLGRAFSNILDNAVKYSEDGGRIDVTAEKLASEIVITFANTGPGIAPHQIPRVFEQFYRIEQSRSTQHGGSGLGLAMVKKIIELHRGQVTLESCMGEMTKVIVHLPYSRQKGLT